MEPLYKIKWVVLALCVSIVSCAKVPEKPVADTKVTLSEHRLQNGLRYWKASKDGIVVEYYEDDCACGLAFNIINNVVNDANKGALDWSKMADFHYMKGELAGRCFVLGASIAKLNAEATLRRIEIENEVNRITEETPDPIELLNKALEYNENTTTEERSVYE